MKTWKLRRKPRPAENRRRAGAIVEFAVILPLLLTILFGIIEFGYVFMVRQSLQHAAREGCRLASLQTSQAPYANVVARINEQAYLHDELFRGPTGYSDTAERGYGYMLYRLTAWHVRRKTEAELDPIRDQLVASHRAIEAGLLGYGLFWATPID